MRDYNNIQEARFFAVFADYYDLETNTARPYTDQEYSLQRMQPLADAAGHPEKNLRVIHVAGTKGKGSTCFYLAALLRGANRRCGVFTSPHLVTVRERFQIDGELVSYETLQAAVVEFEGVLRRHGLRPSLFEIMTLLALRLFAAAGCEFAVMETGIGGLLDATNYIENPVCCAITPVSFDHTQLLGASIQEIAAQKAGIIKPGVPLVCALQPFPEAETVIRRQAELKMAAVHTPAVLADSATWQLQSRPLFSRQNFTVALRVCEVLQIMPCPRAYQPPRLRGRCECINDCPLVVLDAAHNADSAEKLVAAMNELYPGQAFTVVLGIVQGKDVAGILTALAPWAADLILTNPHTAKQSALPELELLARQCGLKYRVLPNLSSRTELPAAQNLLFTGSFFTALIGEKLWSL